MRRNSSGLLSAIGMFLLSAGPAAAGQVSVYERTSYYDISGRSARELLDEMYEKGPLGPYSYSEALAQTQSYFSWDVDFEKRDGMCAAADINMSVDLTYTMPRWTDEAKGSRKLRKTWEKFLESLWIHERGHGEIDRRGANAILEHLAALPPQPTCEALQEQMKALSENIRKDVIEPAQRKYDKLTRDGQTQGAAL